MKQPTHTNIRRGEEEGGMLEMSKPPNLLCFCSSALKQWVELARSWAGNAPFQMPGVHIFPSTIYCGSLIYELFQAVVIMCSNREGKA